MIGLMLAWWRELPGAAVALSSLAGFHSIMFFMNGRPSIGPWFADLTAPAAVFLISDLIRPRFTRSRHRPYSVRVPTRPARSVRLILLALAVVAIGLGWRALPRAGRTPAPPSNVPRIAALSPALGVMLRDLNVTDRIVARHAYDLVLDPSLPVGLDLQFDYEVLLAAKPTHVLLQLQSQSVPDRLARLSAAHNWQVIDFPLLELNDIPDATKRLAALFAPGGDAGLILAMDRAWSPRPAIFRGRVLLLASLDPPSALGPGSWHHQLLERLGGAPAITEGSPYITLDAEDVLAMKPDAILLIMPRDRYAPPASPTSDELRLRLGRLGTLNIPAITDGRLGLIDDPLAHTPSTAMIRVADAMAAILDRWAKD